MGCRAALSDWPWNWTDSSGGGFALGQPIRSHPGLEHDLGVGRIGLSSLLPSEGGSHGAPWQTSQNGGEAHRPAAPEGLEVEVSDTGFPTLGVENAAVQKQGMEKTTFPLHTAVRGPFDFALKKCWKVLRHPCHPPF